MKQPRGNNHKLGPDIRVGFVQLSLGCLMKRPALKLPPLVHFLGTPISVIIIFLISSLRKAGRGKILHLTGDFISFQLVEKVLLVGGQDTWRDVWRTRAAPRPFLLQGLSGD